MKITDLFYLNPIQIRWLNECCRMRYLAGFNKEYLEGKWGFNKKTGLVDVYGNFECSNQKLKDFKGVRFGVVTGTFDCSFNQLTSLEGAPRYVGFDFRCDHNKLTSLEGAPQEIGWLFNFSSNPVSDLIYQTMRNNKCDYHTALAKAKGCLTTSQKLELGLYKGHERAVSILIRYGF